MIYPWQHSQWQKITAAIQQNRLPHALLLSGQNGLGKKEFATQVAQQVLCETKANCGHCRSCQLFQAGNHPDFFSVTPEEDSKSIKIDQIRELIASLNQTAQQGGYQVAVIYPAESMNTAAANALLKTLEEPAGSVLLMLVSHQVGSLPLTILSRCQSIKFQAAFDESTIAWVKSSMLCPEQEALRWLKITQGSPLSISALVSENYLALRDQLLHHWMAIQQKENPIKGAEKLVQTDLSLILSIYYSLAMDLLRLQLNMPMQIIHEDKITVLQSLSQKISRATLLTITEKLQSAWKLWQGKVHVNLTLLLENVFLSMASV